MPGWLRAARKRPLAVTAVAALIAPLSLVVGTGTAAASVSSAAVAHRNIPVCPAPPAGYAHCHAVLHQAVAANGKPAPNATAPTGYSPATYMQAYGWADSSGSLIGTGSGKTVAVVDAYDDPTISSDLAYFSSYYHLACNSCFTKVNQNGGTSYPKANSGWALEIALDVEWAHAIAPDAHILLVEASSSSFNNLLAAESYASMHAQYVTNSWGGSEFSTESSDDAYFATPGVSYFASSGDTGGAVEYPSSSPNVISAGGTTLTDSNGTWTETGWSSAGGGCSAYEKANAAQVTGPTVSCNGTRGTPDVASDADPNTGVSVYDTTSYYGQTGWFEVGGTSAASPVWAARSADRGSTVNAAYIYAGYTGGSPVSPYGTNISFRDVVSGSNGYSAGPGYDLVTGLGSWTGGDTTTTPTPGFTVAASPSSDTVSPGQTASYTVTVTPSGGFTGSVTLAETGCPADVNCTFSPDPVDVTGTSAVTTTLSAPVPAKSTDSGGSTIDITGTASSGTSGSTTSSTSVVLTIQQPSATASMTVNVTTGKITKKGPSYHVPITVTADSSTGSPVAGATVALDVYPGSVCSGTAVSSGSATTASNGTANFTFTTKSGGAYCALATATDTGYSTASGSTTFTVP